jgi:hypothetical protein
MLIQAPVIGSVPAVESGTLFIRASAERLDDLAPARAVLQRLGEVHSVGGLGTAPELKLVATSMLAIVTAGAAELMVAGTRQGLGPAQIFSVLSHVAPGLKARQPVILDNVHSPAMFAVRDLLKDLDLGLALYQPPVPLTFLAASSSPPSRRRRWISTSRRSSTNTRRRTQDDDVTCLRSFAPADRASLGWSRASTEEWILDRYAVVALALLHVLAEEDAASGSTRRPHDQRVPERQLVKAMEIDRSEDQVRSHLNHVRLRISRHVLLRYFRRQTDSRRRDEVLLQDLSGEYSGLIFEMRR